MIGSFDIVYSALCCYKAIHGNAKVPVSYVISEGDEAYPEETWGMKLGQKLYNIRHGGTYKEHKQKLVDLGVDYTIHAKESPVEFDVLLNTLTAYKAVHGDLRITNRYQIAVGDDDYPEEAWEMKLGQKLKDIKYKAYFNMHKQQLLDLGVDYNSKTRSQKPSGFNILCSALRAYKAVFANLKIPECFVVAEGDERFPQETWGMKLGQLLDSYIYNGMSKAHKLRLIDLGVEFKENSTAKPTEFDFLLMALSAYKKVNGNVKVPCIFEISEDDEAYPKETRGLKLGLKLWDIKYGGKFNEYKQKLMKFGVDFTCLNQGRFQSIQPEFNVVFTALTAYKVMHGDVKVPFNYVIAEGDDAYPEEMWGMELGVNLMSIRHAGAFQEHKHKLIELGVDFSSSSSSSGSGSGVSANKKRRRTSE